MNFLFKEHYNFEDLVDIVAILRSPEGCKWDMRQDHHSVRSDLIEETYEVIDAIDRDDRAALQEELGDLMLQVVFHTQMEREIGGFDIDDVTDGICKKLIERHPHVFGDVKVNGEEQILTNWDAIKKASKGQKTQTDAMLSVPRCFPSLLRASKLIGKAEKADGVKNDPQQAMSELEDLLDEMKKCVVSSDDNALQSDICGRLLFSAVKFARAVGVDSEHSLSIACDSFIDEFSKKEASADSQKME